MPTAASVAVVIVALQHFGFLTLEMFLWKTPVGRKTFGSSPEFAQASAALAANQGLYNGFLAAGLLWSLGAYGLTGGRALITFFLACVVVAGVFGAATVSWRIILVQALPAAVALALVWLS